MKSISQTNNSRGIRSARWMNSGVEWTGDRFISRRNVERILRDGRMFYKIAQGAPRASNTLSIFNRRRRRRRRCRLKKMDTDWINWTCHPHIVQYAEPPLFFFFFFRSGQVIEKAGHVNQNGLHSWTLKFNSIKVMVVLCSFLFYYIIVLVFALWYQSQSRWRIGLIIISSRTQRAGPAPKRKITFSCFWLATRPPFSIVWLMMRVSISFRLLACLWHRRPHSTQGQLDWPFNL